MKKFSEYNVRISLSENSDIIYNTLYNTFIAIKSDIKLESVSDLSDDLLELFINNNMIIPQDVNEYEEVIEQWVKKVSDPKEYNLIINPTLKCNFNCWYCYEDHNNAPRMTLKILNQIIKIIKNTIFKGEIIQISFFGGEPFLEFNKIIKPIIINSEFFAKESKKKVHFSFTTNGYLLNDSIIDFLTDYNVKFMQITLDGGRKFHNKVRKSLKGDSYDKIITNVKKLIERNIFVTIRINITPENINTCGDIVDWLNKLPKGLKKLLNINLQQVWQTVNTCDISNQIDDLLDLICKSGVYAYPAIMDNFRNMCYSDKLNTILINSDGNIFKCTAVDFKKEDCISNIFYDTWKDDLVNCFKLTQEKRFNNNSCKICKIFPLCLRGCFKNVSNINNKSKCFFNNDEERKKNLIRTIIKDRVRRDMVYNYDSLK